MKAPAGPPTVYGPEISATRCETRATAVPRGEPGLQDQRAAQPPSSLSTSEKLLEALAEGVQQLQRAQLEHLEKAEMRRLEESPEQCKPGTTTLPALAPPNGNESAVALQDWVEVIDGPLRDISDSSSWWWDTVKERAQQSCKMWVAGPYVWLALKPPAADGLEKGKYSRLSARTAGMMLQAMAEVVRAEMVARAITRSPVALLFRLYTMYQPGGESEKAYILQYLVSPPKASTATDLVTILRLNNVVSELWAKDRDVMFRTQLVKSRLGVDTSPTWETTLQLHQHLRAESESLASGLPTSAKPGAADPTQDSTLSAKWPSTAQDIHDNGTYDDFYKYDSEWKWRRKKVQMVYGAWGMQKGRHVASGCPTKNEGGDGTPFKSKGKAKPKSAPTTPTAKDDGGQGGSAAARAMVAEPEPQPPAPTSPVNQEGSQQGSQSGEVKDALRDAAQALRSLMSSGSTTASSPASTLEGLQRQLDELRLKTMKVSEDVSVLRMTQRTSLDGRVALEPTEVPTLIDSGATHILRHPRDDGELASATRVSVTLANDEKRDLLQTESGAILSTSKDTQPILPMAELVRAGCEISWKRGVFKVVHPVWGELRTALRGGCPELAQEQAAKLVNEIEKKKLQEFREGVSLLKSKLEHLVHEERLPWTTYASRYLESGLAKDLWKALQGSFLKSLPEASLDALCSGVRLDGGWQHLKTFPFPRRLRKRLLDSKQWIIYLSVHRDEVLPRPELHHEDAVVLTAHPDLLPQVYEALLWAATGRIAAVVGSTPGSSMMKDSQMVRLARAFVLYVIGRLARPTSRVGFCWTAPKEGRGEALDTTLRDFKGATSMDEVDVVKASGTEGKEKVMSIVTNYNGESLDPQCYFEDVEMNKCVEEAMSPEEWKDHVKAGLQGDRTKAARVKYLLVAKFTIPKSYVTGEFEPTGSDPPVDEEVGHEDLFDEEEGGEVMKASVYDSSSKDLLHGDEEEDTPADEDALPEEERDEGKGVGPIPMDVKPPQATYLLFAEPMLNDKGPTIASAVQAVVLYLQSLNIPVLRFHSDRAAQLMTRSLTQWLHGQAIRVSTSTPGVPQENGAAENAVKEVKLTTRKILSSSTLDKAFWPVAARAAASIQRARVLQQVPRMVTGFGAKVLVKKRRYAASGALIRLEFDERWAEGIYLGLSDQVSNGHRVYVDGIFTRTKNVKDKAKLVDAGDEGRDDGEKRMGDEPELPRARRRIVGKSTPRVATLDRRVDLGVYDDDLPEDQEEPGVYDDDLQDDQDESGEDDGLVNTAESAVEEAHLPPRVAALDQGRAEAQTGQMEFIDPEDYAKEIIYNEDDVNEDVIERLFELLPSQGLPRQTEDCGASGLSPKAWASGVYRHGGVLGVRNSPKEFPYSTRLVNQFIRGVLGESATWSTFSLHRNLSVKRHRDSHNARDELSYLIPISDFRQGGLWTQAGVDEVVDDDEVVVVDGKRGSVKPLQSEEGSKKVISFNPRQWHATMPWTGDRLVLAVYKVRGLNKIKPVDEDVALDLGFPLPTNDAESPRMCKLIGGEGEQPGPVPQEEAEVELEPVEEFMYIRMSEAEWNTTIARYGPDHYVAEMAVRWRRIARTRGGELELSDPGRHCCRC
ncbi:GIP [Symbiodinium sp. CCMP2456]|nr:GIP [Symbiodinium sp. CCMP2456]